MGIDNLVYPPNPQPPPNFFAYVKTVFPSPKKYQSRKEIPSFFLLSNPKRPNVKGCVSAIVRGGNHKKWGWFLGKVPSEFQFEPRSPKYGQSTVLGHNAPKMGLRVGKMAQNGRKRPMVRLMRFPQWGQMDRQEPTLGSRGVFGPFGGVNTTKKLGVATRKCALGIEIGAT